jgi:hypothetical protein
MAAAIVLRDDYESAQLRELARQSEDADQVRRLLALALVYDGGSRSAGTAGLQTFGIGFYGSMRRVHLVWWTARRQARFRDLIGRSDVSWLSLSRMVRSWKPTLSEPCMPPERSDDHRHDDVEHDRQDQRVPGHRDRREAQQQGDDRREGNHHDRVVEGNLAQREMRLAIDQVR